MNDPSDDRDHRLAASVRDACIQAALEAYENAGISGLCHEGRWELAVGEMRQIDLGRLLGELDKGDPES
ncbi:hypothetical protein [Marinobacterium aestuariivivens]|uniref:Acetyltransferase n=1 Tax=Marinobacterium aestuariivivens TaxID=1698799 RepID=A0ABW2A282_9GAMM